MDNFGLISNNHHVPLKTVSFVGIINENIGEFTVTQQYNNDENKLLETVYLFPLSTSASITNVTIQINDRVLQSKLTTKNEASQEYSTAIENKHKALLLEKLELGYQIKIGNIEP